MPGNMSADAILSMTAVACGARGAGLNMQIASLCLIGKSGDRAHRLASK